MSVKRVRIGDARAICDKYRLAGVMIWAYDSKGHVFQAASYGPTKAECLMMGDLLDQVSNAINTGAIEPRPERMEPKARAAETVLELAGDVGQLVEDLLEESEFVYGKGVRHTLMQRAADALEAMAARFPAERTQ